MGGGGERALCMWVCPPALLSQHASLLFSSLRIYYEGKEEKKAGLEILETTPYSRSANLSSGGPGQPKAFLFVKRVPESLGLNTLGVMDICIINPSKGENTPHTFCKVDRNLNTSMVSPATHI